MHVTVLVPDVHDQPTGGTIYNRRIIAGLERHGAVEVVQWRPETEPSLPHDPPENAVLLVDSLLTRHEAPLRALRAGHPTATLVLLAHYLHCIDPNEADGPAAATERAVLPLFDGVITTSPYAKRAIADEGVPPSRIEVVPPGLDESYRESVPDRPTRDTPRLLTVANVQTGKGLPTLIEALGALSDIPWSWTLIGDHTLAPEFAETLNETLRRSPVSERVTMLGRVSPDDLRAEYDRADVFVLPSRFETCSMATREAMARGLPVVATDVGGLPDNFGEEPAGCLVPPGHADALADALRLLLTRPAAREKRGAAARARSEAFPAWPEAAERVYAAVRALRSPTPEDGRES